MKISEDWSYAPKITSDPTIFGVFGAGAVSSASTAAVLLRIECAIREQDSPFLRVSSRVQHSLLHSLIY